MIESQTFDLLVCSLLLIQSGTLLSIILTIKNTRMYALKSNKIILLKNVFFLEFLCEHVIIL
jgi:hypothetical protein